MTENGSDFNKLAVALVRVLAGICITCCAVYGGYSAVAEILFYGDIEPHLAVACGFFGGITAGITTAAFVVWFFGKRGA